jgi:riboflavin synthase alpha subunit
MASSGMLRRLALVRTDVSEELSAFFIEVTRIAALGTTLAVTRAKRRNIPEDVIPHSHRSENLKSYKYVDV